MIRYRENMTAEETAELLRELDELDAAFARAEAFSVMREALYHEWNNMLGIPPTPYSEEHESEGYAELRRAALDHRGRP